MSDFVVLWDLDGTMYHVCMDHRDRLAEGVAQYLDTGRDTLIQMSAMSGDSFVIRASQVHSWQVSTQDGRKMGEQFVHALDTEVASLRAELGIWDD